MADQDDNQRLPEVPKDVAAAAEQNFNRALRVKEEAMHRLIEFMDRIGWPPDEQIETPPAQETDDANRHPQDGEADRLGERHGAADEAGDGGRLRAPVGHRLRLANGSIRFA
jgi:hypothetical protein